MIPIQPILDEAASLLNWGAGGSTHISHLLACALENLAAPGGEFSSAELVACARGLYAVEHDSTVRDLMESPGMRRMASSIGAEGDGEARAAIRRVTEYVTARRFIDRICNLGGVTQAERSQLRSIFEDHQAPKPDTSAGALLAALKDHETLLRSGA